MKRIISDLVSELNTLLIQASNKIIICKWTAGRNKNIVTLSNGVIISGVAELRKFRQRVRSKSLQLFIDTIYNSDDIQERDKIVSQLQAQHASEVNKLFWINLPPAIKTKRLIHAQSIYKFVDRTAVDRTKNWMLTLKGQTKETNQYLKSMSEKRIGTGNPMYGKKHKPETKKKQSDLIKQRIRDGEWTPNVHNSRTHWSAEYNGKKYRSSWELIYHCFNPTDLYEQIRIPYIIDNEHHTYIVDFYNPNANILTEIKPSCRLNEKIFQKKYQAAVMWCHEHQCIFRILTEEYFIENINKIEELNIPSLEKTIRGMKYEAYKKNRN
ncbi:MAG: Tn7 transposase TnsA N-terminal domain-containing protein [Nitrosopumilaceae archaeon]